MPYERNRLLALLLNFIPGVGHLYWGKKGRGITYPILFFGGIFLDSPFQSPRIAMTSPYSR